MAIHRNLHLWLPGYLLGTFARPRIRRTSSTKHLIVCLADHYEPAWLEPGIEIERRRVDRWMSELPDVLDGHVDSDGLPPRHTFFFPEEEYRPEHLDKLSELCRMGIGEIEVHLHHGNDTAENFARTLSDFVALLHDRHGCFAVSPRTKKPAWAFIHGNWALCNSGQSPEVCGVNEELRILNELGCYMDLTLPSAPDPSQTKIINTIYYADDIPGQPKSHNQGRAVVAGRPGFGDLLMLQGPLGLAWHNRKFGVVPRIENGDISGASPPSPKRVSDWVSKNICVKGRENWIFVKLHTHGTQERNMDTLLGAPRDELHSYLEEHYKTNGWKLHYVSSREAYNLICAAEAGEDGEPGEYRDYVIPKPENFC